MILFTGRWNTTVQPCENVALPNMVQRVLAYDPAISFSSVLFIFCQRILSYAAPRTESRITISCLCDNRERTEDTTLIYVSEFDMNNYFGEGLHVFIKEIKVGLIR